MIDLPTIQTINSQLDKSIQQHIDSKTKPIGSLGKIEAVAAQLARIQQSLAPQADSCELLLFAGDHGAAQSGVSAYPSDVTRQMVLNFLTGGAAACVFSRMNEVELKIIDAGVAGEAIEDANLVSRRIAGGTRNFIFEPAMTPDQMMSAFDAGCHLGRNARADVVGFGEMGIGNTSSAAMLAHKTKQLPLLDIIGRGTGLSDAELNSKRDLLMQASQRTDDRLTVEQSLCEYGGFEIVMMTGAMFGAASKRKPLLIDGYIATAAAMCAVNLDPAIRAYCIFTHHSAEMGHQLMMRELGAEGLLDLQLRLGEGTGALLAWPLVKCAAAMMRDMASFAGAEVNGRI